MRGIISSHISTGSRTCIVVGGLDGVIDLDLGAYRAVLWFASGSAQPWPERLGIGPDKVTIETVENLGADRTTKVLDDLIQRDALCIPSVLLTEQVGGATSSLFLPVIDAIFAQLESHRSARFFRQQLGFPTQCNVLANLAAYVRQRAPDAWSNALDGIPAFICGAGPSLDASAGKLAEFEQHGVIFATDSALSALAKRDIHVDFALAIDPRKTPANCLPEGGRRPDRLMLASASLPAWRQTLRGDQTYFLSGRQLTEDWLEENGIHKTRACVADNCGATAFELALHLGCRPICLFGMDHAVDSLNPARWHHQQVGSGLKEQLPDLLANQRYPMVPGNFQDEIATPLFREWRGLDARCAGLPAGLVLNVIDRGARLSNTTVVRPADFSVADHRERKSSRLTALAPATQVREPDVLLLLDGIRQAAATAMPAFAEARDALSRGQRTRVAALLIQAFTQKPFSQLMGNYCLKVIPHLLRSEAVEDSQWDRLITETQELLGLAGKLY